MTHPSLRLLAVALGLLFLAGCPPSAAGPCTSDSQCSPSRCCSGKCVDVQSSAAHCGLCGNVCSGANGAARCTAGACAISCSSGFGDCNQLAKDGCEIELTSAVDHCGGCGTACQSANASHVCERSQCLQSGCKSGFGDCNGTDTDGCEVDLKSAIDHCGGCGKKCAIADGVGLCTQSTCTVAACNLGFGDCDLATATGCETDLTTTVAHCGGCGLACGAGYRCKASKCVAPELLFYGGVINIQSPLATNVVSSFNLDTHAWSAVSTTGIETPGNRFGHLAVWDSVGNQMLVWGGYFSGNVAADTFLWALDFGAQADGGTSPIWKKRVTTGGPPTNRGLFGWAWDKATRTLFVYGGTDADNNVVYDDLWQLDVARLKWTQRTEPGSPPGGRYQPSMVWDSSRARVVVGQGLDDNFIPTAGFYAFDPAADGGGWSPLVASGAPTERAAAAFLGAALPLQVWGGIDDFGDILGDLYQLDELDGGAQWTRVLPDNPPVERGFPTAAGVLDRRFLFGGFTPAGGGLSELWELSEDAGWTLIADGGINFVHPGTVFSTAVGRE